ncbi:MAG: sulfatase [Actinomycetota bacterium]|nr:sulfatase [Actinomycetota bacterium]
MTDHQRRRAIAGITAGVTALATLAAVGVIGLTSTASQASTPPAEAARPTAGALALSPASTDSAATSPQAAAEVGSIDDIDNVVLVLADDLDWALFREVPRLAALQDEGMTFTHQVVADSLCCPSRASILRSQYIHNHLVISNTSETGGGWPTFRDSGAEADCLPVWLQTAGRTTALFGKYLNDYPKGIGTERTIPPGWSEWRVPVSRGDSYTGYDYVLNENGRLKAYGSEPEDFLNDVITTDAVEFIGSAPDGFFAMLSVYNPHKPAPVAARNANTHVDTVAPRTPSYNVRNANEPTWMSKLKPLTPWKQAQLDDMWRQRAQSAESVADSVDAVMAELERTGRADRTLVIVTSDNGYHAGVHGLSNGKRTAFREDTVVPMVMIGPGMTPGARVDALTATVDLGPTITELLDAQAPDWTDGRSLVELMTTGQEPGGWRTAVLSESMGRSVPGDPDYQPQAPPMFSALRTQEWLFVVYRDGEQEMYDLVNDPNEMSNIAASADPALIAGLYSQLQAMRACSGITCRTADSIIVPGVVG